MKNMTTLKMLTFPKCEHDLQPGVDLEQLLGPMLAVLGRSWALCCQSWAALGAHVDGLDRSWELCGQSWGGRRPKSGPSPSGSAISKRLGPPEEAESPSAPYGCLSIDNLHRFQTYVFMHFANASTAFVSVLV